MLSHESAWIIKLNLNKRRGTDFTFCFRFQLAPPPRGQGVCGAGAGDVPRQGRAVQVDPMEFVLKAPGTKRLKLECDKLLSSFAFKFNLRRYSKGTATAEEGRCVYTRALHSSKFRLDVSTFGGTRWVVSVYFSNRNGSG
jgi:hypothetical protein